MNIKPRSKSIQHFILLKGVCLYHGIKCTHTCNHCFVISVFTSISIERLFHLLQLIWKKNYRFHIQICCYIHVHTSMSVLQCLKKKAYVTKVYTVFLDEYICVYKVSAEMPFLLIIMMMILTCS